MARKQRPQSQVVQGAKREIDLPPQGQAFAGGRKRLIELPAFGMHSGDIRQTDTKHALPGEMKRCANQRTRLAKGGKRRVQIAERPGHVGKIEEHRKRRRVRSRLPVE